MFLRSFVAITLIHLMFAGAAIASSKGVSKNMETLAKALYANGGTGNNKYIFNVVTVIEVGKNLGRGKPVKYRIKGIRGYQTLSSPPPGWSSPVAVWVGDFIEAEQPFDDTFVVFYTKNEFDKLVACTDGGFICVHEENLNRYRSNIEEMKKQHILAQKQDQNKQEEYAQRLLIEKAQRAERARLDQMRANASVPSSTLGTYRCVDRYYPGYETPLAEGELTLTDVDVSYVHIFPNERPYQSKVIFSFDNIISAKLLGKVVSFALRQEVWIRHIQRVASVNSTF